MTRKCGTCGLFVLNAEQHLKWCGDRRPTTDARRSGLISTDGTAAAVIRSAIALDAYLRANVGDNADWPIHLHADNMADADQMAAHLSDFSLACAAYRATAEGHTPAEHILRLQASIFLAALRLDGYLRADAANNADWKSHLYAHIEGLFEAACAAYKAAERQAGHGQ